MNRWEIEEKVKKIVENNCKEVPWEGTEVDKCGIVSDVLILIEKLTEKKNNSTDNKHPFPGGGHWDPHWKP